MVYPLNASPVSIGGALKLFYWLALKTNIILERIFLFFCLFMVKNFLKFFTFYFYIVN